MRIVIATMMMLHGMAHLIGFLTPWRLISPEGAAYRTTILAGRVDLGTDGVRALGIAWLATAVTFWIAAAGAFAGQPWWVPLAICVSSVSLGLSLVALPDSRIGVPINVALIAALVVVQRLGHS